MSISVIIPAHNAALYLPACLRHLNDSTTRVRECIVVDDCSTDDSVEVARQYGATVLSTSRRRGPAHARNIGARAAQGDVLLFLDADVCVHADAVERVFDDFERDADLTALIGSYDDSPFSKDFLSQYRNLLHCFIHQTGRERASTFWSGCGAIRRQVFLEYSGFDEHSYKRPAIEDIELGYRLARAGKKIALDRNLEVKHLKVWGFWKLVKTDILDRGIPWTELILRDRHMPNDLNLQFSQRLSVAMVFLWLAIAAVAAIYWRGYFITPLFALVFFLLARYWVEPGAQPKSKQVIVLVSAGMFSIAWLSLTHHMLGLIPPVLGGFILLLLRERYSGGSRARRQFTGWMMRACILITVLFVLTYLPHHALTATFFVLFCVILILNIRFYLFLARKQGRLFALTAIPFHILYLFYSGIAFVAGLCRYTFTNAVARERQHEAKPNE